LNIPGQGIHNLVFVATENNDVYAFDGLSNSGPNGGLLWHINLGTAAASPPPNNYFGSRYGGMYSDIKPLVGITSTPVIDLATNKPLKFEVVSGAQAKIDSPNENFPIRNFEVGIELNQALLEEFAKAPRGAHGYQGDVPDLDKARRTA